MLLGLFAQNVSCMKRPFSHITYSPPFPTPNPLPVFPQPAEMLIIILSNQIQSFYPIFLSLSDVYRPWLEMGTKRGNTLKDNNKRDLKKNLNHESWTVQRGASGIAEDVWSLFRMMNSPSEQLGCFHGEKTGGLWWNKTGTFFFCVSKGQGFAMKLQIWWQQGRKLTSK